ncbi:TadE family type IV pilus minor pilin [Streptomyces sp. NPDC054802]
MPSSDAPCAGGIRERGSVTAEAAVAVPALVVFAMALVWALTAAAAQIQCVDAARAGARAAARSEPRAAAVAAARSAAPSGSVVTLTRGGDLWRVRVEADAPGPGALALTLSAEAVASAEDTMGSAAWAAGHEVVVRRDTEREGDAGPGGRGRREVVRVTAAHETTPQGAAPVVAVEPPLAAASGPITAPGAVREGSPVLVRGKEAAR